MVSNQPGIPKYAPILEEIGKHLKERKNLLLKRSLQIIWPLFILFAYGTILSELYDLKSIADDQGLFAPIFIPLWIIWILSLIYIVVMRSIFFVEKLIWVDSHFDGKNLEPKSSWKIAKKLFWPSIKFKLYIVFKYYVPSILLFIVAIAILNIFVGSLSVRAFAIVMFAQPILLLPGIFIYLYYLKIKLRYTWFIFIDTYGSDITYKEIIHRMNALNLINKSDSFRQALVINLGEDTIKSAINAVIRLVSAGVEKVGNIGGSGLGRFLGLSARAYGEEVSLHVSHFAKLVAIYVLFRTAKKANGEDEQFINEKLYSLAA